MKTNKSHVLTAFAFIVCMFLIGDQGFAQQKSAGDGSTDIHDAPAAVAAIARSADIPVPPGARQAPAVPPVSALKEVSMPIPPAANKPGLIPVAEAICRYGKLRTSGAGFFPYFGMELNHPFRDVTAEH